MAQRTAGIVLIILGLVAALVSFQFVEHDPYGSVLTSDVVFYDVLKEDYLALSDFLRKFPSYADMDAEQLATRLHAHFFSDTPYDTYRLAFLKTTSADVPDTDISGDPLGIRGELKEITPTDVGARAVFGIDAIDHGLVTVVHKRVAFQYSYALASGALIGLAGFVLLSLSIRQKKPDYSSGSRVE